MGSMQPNSSKSKQTLTAADLDAEGITMSVDRAAQYLGISKPYAYALAHDGRLPTIKLGGTRVRVPTAALRNLLTV